MAMLVTNTEGQSENWPTCSIENLRSPYSMKSTALNHPMKALLVSAFLLGSVLVPSVAQAQWACTRESWSSVNVRRGPGQGYGVIASIPNGVPLRILSWVWGADGMAWIRVESGGIVGYSRSDYICR